MSTFRAPPVSAMLHPPASALAKFYPIMTSSPVVSLHDLLLQQDPSLQHLSRARLVAWVCALQSRSSCQLTARLPAVASLSQLPSVLVSMPVILSVDVGTASLGYAIYNPNARRIHAWRVKDVCVQQSSYMTSLVDFDEDCYTHPFDTVVIEQQLRHLNFQMGRLEANLEGYFKAKEKANGFCCCHLGSS